jgi:hypothetical protein
MIGYFIINEIFGSLSLVIMWVHYIPIFLKWNAPDMYCKIYLVNP